MKRIDTLVNSSRTSKGKGVRFSGYIIELADDVVLRGRQSVVLGYDKNQEKKLASFLHYHLILGEHLHDAIIILLVVLGYNMLLQKL